MSEWFLSSVQQETKTFIICGDMETREAEEDEKIAEDANNEEEGEGEKKADEQKAVEKYFKVVIFGRDANKRQEALEKVKEVQEKEFEAEQFWDKGGDFWDKKDLGNSWDKKEDKGWG